MPSDFEVIQRYLSLCEKIVDGESEEIALSMDQKVPQTTSIVDDKIMPLVIKTEVDPFGTFSLEDGAIFSDMNTTSFLTPSAGCTIVTEVADQKVDGGENSSLLDLDQTIYDEFDTNYMDYKPSPQIRQQEYSVVSDSHGAFFNNLYNVESMVITHVTQDIETESSILKISADPLSWSVEDVANWIDWMQHKYSLPEVNSYAFQMNGISLCCLSEYDFQRRYPNGGSTLFSELEIWKNACKLCQAQASQAPTHALYTNDIADLTCCDVRRSPSPASLSPASPSSASCDSVSSSGTASMSPKSATEERITLYQRKTEPSKIADRGGSLITEHKQTIHLWQFLKELLHRPQTYSNCIKWLDRSKGIFKIEDSNRVAKEWGKRKNRPAMNYDKLSRSIRQYYKKGIIKKTEHSKRLVYQFCQPYL